MNEQKEAALQQKLRDEEVRRAQLTRELAVMQLGEIEVGWLVGSFVRSFVRSFIRSFLSLIHI